MVLFSAMLRALGKVVSLIVPDVRAATCRRRAYTAFTSQAMQ